MARSYPSFRHRVKGQASQQLVVGGRTVERDRLLRLEERLHGRVVGQDEAVEAVAEAVRRARAGLCVDYDGVQLTIDIDKGAAEAMERSSSRSCSRRTSSRDMATG